MIRFAFSARIVFAFLDLKFLVGLLDGELPSSNKADHVIVHDRLYIRRLWLEYHINDLNTFDASHIRGPSAYFNYSYARGNFLTVIWTISRDDLCGPRGGCHRK